MLFHQLHLFSQTGTVRGLILLQLNQEKSTITLWSHTLMQLETELMPYFKAGRVSNTLVI